MNAPDLYASETHAEAVESAPSTPTRCANCGEPAGPSYCPHCGQEVEALRGPLAGIVREFFAEWISLDGRLVRTLRELLVPGRLSVRYLEGHRAPYLRPFRLYLVASVVLFSTLLALDNPSAEGVEVYVGDEMVSQPVEGKEKRSIKVMGQESRLQRWLLPSRETTVARMRELTPQEIVDRLSSGVRRILPITLILFVPFLALGLKLLYLRGQARRRLYYDHLVFALHYQAALFLALALAWLFVRLMTGPFAAGPTAYLAYAAVGLAMPAVYMPLALRRYYGQSWPKTVAKAVILLVVYFQLLTWAIDLSVTLTFRDL